MAYKYKKGDKIYNVTFIEITTKRKGKYQRALFECPLCGTIFESDISEVRRKDERRRKTNCGCFHGNQKYNPKHKRLLKIYHDMKGRCYTKTNHAYKYYGGRGIKICNEWLQNPNNFIEWAINNGYKDNLTIERIDNNGNYTPKNCKWITQKEQSYNRRTTKLNQDLVKEIRNSSLSPKELSIKYDINISTIKHVVYNHTW